MIELILSLIGLGVYSAAETAHVKRVGKEICQEKGWGEYKLPNTNESLQQKYFRSYVDMHYSIKPIHYGYGDNKKYNIHHDIFMKLDEETGLAIKDESGNYIRTTRLDRYRMAVRDFEELGYFWDDRYNPSAI